MEDLFLVFESIFISDVRNHADLYQRLNKKNKRTDNWLRKTTKMLHRIGLLTRERFEKRNSLEKYDDQVILTLNTNQDQKGKEIYYNFMLRLAHHQDSAEYHSGKILRDVLVLSDDKSFLKNQIPYLPYLMELKDNNVRQTSYRSHSKADLSKSILVLLDFTEIPHPVFKSDLKKSKEFKALLNMREKYNSKQNNNGPRYITITNDETIAMWLTVPGKIVNNGNNISNKLIVHSVVKPDYKCFLKFLSEGCASSTRGTAYGF